MGLFNFFKKNKQESKQEDAGPQEKYWLLGTIENEVIDPTWEQIESAVINAKPEKSTFVTLAYMNAGLEVDTVQAVGDENGYRLEALSLDGDIFVNDGLTYEETLKYFDEFYRLQKVVGYRSWPKE